MAGMLFISCIRFSMQLFIAEGAFVAGWERKRGFLARLLMGLAAYFLIAFMIFKICFQVKLEEILFAGVCGYATQHMAFALIMMLQQLSGITLPVVWDFLFVRLLPYVAISLTIYLGVVRRYEGKGELKSRDMRMVLLALGIIFTVVIISVLVDYPVFRENSGLLQNVFCKIYAIVCSLLAIFIAYYMSRQNRILHENEMMESLLHNMGEQQKMSRETINIINIKCHDLKYRISRIPRIEDAGDQKEYIEGVKDADEEKRIISVSVSRRNQGSHIHMENYCVEQIAFEDGLPLTTKPDTAYHGFGVRSIKYIAQKYKGTLLMRAENNRFLVDILFYPG